MASYGMKKMDEKKLDPVGKEDGDIDNDGDQDDSDEYLAKRRKAIGKAIKTQKNEIFSPMDRALKQKIKDPKSGKEVTVGSVKNQGEKRYDSTLVKKANDIFRKAMEKERAAKKR